MLKKVLRFGTVAWITIALAGCATVAKRPSVIPPESKPAQAAPTEKAKGVYHKVDKGETLWRIARTYKVSVDDIIAANNIPNAASIEENQLLLIPGVDAVQKVPPQASAAGGLSDGKDTEFAWPVDGRVISYFDDRKGAWRNRGIDIKITDDNIIKASRGGRVVFADHLAGYGNAVILDHDDGFFSVYGHNDTVLVKLGDYVFKGEKIALAGGKPGRAYEHFEIRKGDRAENPLHYLP